MSVQDHIQKKSTENTRTHALEFASRMMMMMMAHSAKAVFICVCLMSADQWKDSSEKQLVFPFQTLHNGMIWGPDTWLMYIHIVSMLFIEK